MGCAPFDHAAQGRFAIKSALFETGDPDVADAICNSITQAIIDRRLEPGAKLPEDVIGSHFGVSRTVVRSAMNRLQRERLVEFKKHRGAFIARPTVEDARNVFDARRIVERAVVERAIGRMKASDLDALMRHTDHELELQRSRPRREVVDLSGDFHIHLAQIAGNEVLTSMLELLVRRSALVIALYGNARDTACGADDHRVLIRALEARDTALACKIMDDHLTDVEASLRLDQEPRQEMSLAEILAIYSSRPQ